MCVDNAALARFKLPLGSRYEKLTLCSYIACRRPVLHAFLAPFLLSTAPLNATLVILAKLLRQAVCRPARSARLVTMNLATENRLASSHPLETSAWLAARCPPNATDARSLRAPACLRASIAMVRLVHRSLLLSYASVTVTADSSPSNDICVCPVGTYSEPLSLGSNTIRFACTVTGLICF